ncbi:hypothetical protein PoB_006034000 [Plakobranchus ocellatus]|uniref:Uncharacterized protein n=1 Tax=Plakobranchus ocellatus TaxID=259542 RepID=A0AAV4CPP1_9GAST|nr:hypothetical protein PoB_006034000 [Plakobranchus ocellatus]
MLLSYQMPRSRAIISNANTTCQVSLPQLHKIPPNVRDLSWCPRDITSSEGTLVTTRITNIREMITHQQFPTLRNITEPCEASP